MSDITVINKYKPVGLPALTTRVYVGRPSPLGNPYRCMNSKDRPEVVAKFEGWLRQRMRSVNPTSAEMNRLLDILKDGRSLQLECCCAPLQCHADVIKKVLNELLVTETA